MSDGISRRTFLRGSGLTAAAALLLAGCARGSTSGGASSKGGGQPTVEFWSQLAGSKEQAGQDLQAAFEKSSLRAPMETNLYGSPDQLNQKLLTGFVGGILPDLFIQHWDYSLAYASGGTLRSMGQTLTKAGVDPKFAGYSVQGNDTVTAPLYGTTRALTINADIVSKSGLDPNKPPTNWAELREWGKTLVRWKGSALKVAGIHIYANDLELFEAFLLLLQGAGGQLLTADKSDIAFDSEEGVAAAEFLRQLVVEDKVTVPGFGIGDSASAPFYSGRAAVAFNGNYSIQPAQDAHVNLAVAKMPGREGGYTSIIDPFCFGIPRGADAGDGALRFVEFALRPENQVAFATSSKNIPVVPEALSSAKIAADKPLAVFAEAASYAPDHAPATSAYTRMTTTVSRSLQQMFFSGLAPDTAVHNAARTVRPWIQEGAQA